MAIITDPDRLDRFQVAIDPVYKTISLRGSGTFRVQGSAASGTAGGDLIDSTNNIGTAASVGDVVAIVSDPNGNNGLIGHYTVAAKAGASGLVLDRNVPQTGGSGVSYQIYSPGSQGLTAPSLADGVTMQCLYSFLKEEWRVNSLSASGEDLIKYTFPMVSITSEQFEIGGVSNSNWEFADDTGDGSLAAESSRNLIRTGGWASINTSGQIIENYPGIITLGTVEADSQIYYQLTSATTNPNDFVLTGPVNQSIRTLETIGGASVDGNKTPASGYGGLVVFDNATSSIRATNGTNLYALGFTSGELIQVRQAATAANNGLFQITASGGDLGVSGVFVDGTMTNESDSQVLLSPLTDNRDYLVLRVRTKGKSYGQSEIADIGVTTINTIVNRFPLAEATDPAITLDDGVLQGDGGADNVAFQSVSSKDTDTNGDFVDAGNGLITFTSAGAAFNTAGANNVPGASQMFAGDTVEITGPADNPNIGVYEVQSVDSDTQLTLFAEPGRTVDAVTNDGALEFTARSQVRVAQASDGATADNGTGLGTFTSTGSNFTTAGVASGDFLRIKSGNHQGFYKVETVVSATNLSVNTLGSNSDTAGIPEDGEFGVDSSVTFDVVQKGMNLQYKRVVGAGGTVTSITGGNQLNGVSFTNANGFYVGAIVTITGTQYLVTAVNSGTSITIENLDLSEPSPTITGTPSVSVEYGFVRKLGSNANGTDFSFNWKLEGNGGDLGECFQYLQRELRRTTDVDLGDSLFRGDITDLLMTFASPNGNTLNLFIDNVDAGVKNNLTQQDAANTDRNFDFLVALKIALNNNIRNAATNKIVVFYTDQDGTSGNGDEFGTTGAVIVQDSANQDMVATDQTGAEVTFEYVHPGVGQDDAITIVCISDTTGQYVQTTSTLTRTNEVTASLVAGLERNYSNP